MMNNKYLIIKKVIIILIILLLIFLLLLLFTNLAIINQTKDKIYYTTDTIPEGDYDCILILGAGVRPDGKPSHMLEDRLIAGIALYKAGVSDKIIMSGDHGSENYDEVNTMRSYALESGVDSKDIFMDHAGFNTYDSIIRAVKIFGAKKILIVTQEYHLYRAIYIAESFGMEASGYSADLRSYQNQYIRDMRQVIARTKDFFASIIKPAPKYLGDPIPLSEDGNITIG